MEKIRVMALWQ